MVLLPRAYFSPASVPRSWIPLPPSVLYLLPPAIVSLLPPGGPGAWNQSQWGIVTSALAMLPALRSSALFSSCPGSSAGSRVSPGTVCTASLGSLPQRSKYKPLLCAWPSQMESSGRLPPCGHLEGLLRLGLPGPTPEFLIQ